MSRIPSKQIVLDTDETLANNSDILIASQKAIKSYVDNSTGSLVQSFKSTLTGDGSTTTFVVNHALDTDDLMIQVYETFGDKESIATTTSRPDTNNVNVTFALAPVNGDDYRVLILAI